MYRLFSHEGEVSYRIKEWVCDTIEDLDSLLNKDGSMAMGSTAFVLSTSELYMLNGDGKWVKI